jgi:hypothetical protein
MAGYARGLKPRVPDSHLGQIKVSVMDFLESIDKSKADYEGEPRNNTTELEAYETGRSKVEEEFIKEGCRFVGQSDNGSRVSFHD